jgi:heptaprenyl diphosphate synthase
MGGAVPATTAGEDGGVSNPFDLPQLDPALEHDLRTGLDAVEKRLHIAAESADSFVAEAASHLLEAGGKRFRPLLALLAAQFGDPTSEQVIDAAAVVELTHLATLYHDDVMDEAPLRRGAASANDRYGNIVAILTGDFLFARASDILADLGTEAVRIQARTFERLVAGQIRETIGPADGQDPVVHYLDVIAEKTGSLIATSGLFGAMFAGASADVGEVLRRFGEEIGIAFQLSDDILDIASDSAESGKTPGTDLREGVPTLPVLYAFATGDAEAVRIQALIDPEELAEADEAAVDARITEALTLLRAHDGMTQARADLARRAQKARDLLAPLPEVPAKEALEALTDLVVSRTS